MERPILGTKTWTDNSGERKHFGLVCCLVTGANMPDARRMTLKLM